MSSDILPTSIASATKPPTRTTVLCVEDDNLQLQVRKLLFESAGFGVLSAECGDKALDLFRTNAVDVVVLDYWMSGMNGVALATELRRLRPGIPIILLSGSTSDPGESAGLVDAWFQKAQVEPEELLASVTQLVKQKAE